MLYHSDESVLLGAPTGSGKTAVAEIAIMRMLNEHPGAKVPLVLSVGVSIAALVFLVVAVALRLRLVARKPLDTLVEHRFDVACLCQQLSRCL